MPTQYTRSRPTLIRFAALLALLLLMHSGIEAVAAQDDFGQPVDGQRVYDRTGLLTASELELLEQRAAEVEEAGAPVVVYLQANDADFDETLDDGRELMESWDVQSSEGARDGVVMFLNLEPDDLRHGQLALVAGEAHFDGGNLPQYQLDRITSVMRSILADGETATGIARGLEMVTESLTMGPPPPPEPSGAEKFAIDLSEGPFSIVNIVSVFIAAALGVFTMRKWREQPDSQVAAIETMTPPGDLMPAAVGALVDGRVNDMEVEATLLDLARRGALAIEPADAKKKVQIRLLDSSVLENEFEQLVWASLEEEAQDGGLIPNDKLSKVRSHWGPAKEALQRGLESRGWFDPDAGRRRMPLYIAGAVTLVVAVGVFLILVTGNQIWSLVGLGLLAGGALVAIFTAYEIPGTTTEGETQAMPWRGYLEGLKSAKGDPAVELDLDEAMPYAIAMNAAGALDKRLKQASESGYAPAWLGNSLTTESWAGIGFYPYWTAFHTSVSPTVGAGAGGAAAGSGGSGGGF